MGSSFNQSMLTSRIIIIIKDRETFLGLSNQIKSETLVKSWSRGYKTFFILNSVGHEILNAHKYNNIKKFSIFQAQISLECYFFLLINVKMPTIVGILTFMSRKNFTLN